MGQSGAGEECGKRCPKDVRTWSMMPKSAKRVSDDIML
jgi:hypothetical protein